MNHNYLQRTFALSALLIAPVLWAGCVNNDEPQEAVAVVPSETTDVSTKAETGTKKSTEDKQINPVLQSARRNASFDVEKWLQSDYSFFRRTNPHRISEFDPIIKKMARRYGFDWRLIAAQIFTESTFRSVAKSGAGAVGLMQILPSTAQFLGTDPRDLITPEVNIAVGCMYSRRLYSLWGRQTKDKVQR
ncbi:MAG: transglycosylase SLT domain-containing protein, partial [Chitinivibrionales bacterium]|nr:transglycosylase SLT domain-containing protein [Chitinivibrionales bacterium]MBD3357571.1 transglycosylase SLT domain-containing protein [Chitinivibrionales bacterium]